MNIHILRFVKGNEVLTLAYSESGILDNSFDVYAPTSDGWMYDSETVINLDKIDRPYSEVCAVWSFYHS